MTRDEAFTRVQRGAALLDNVHPEWWQRIDLQQLRMQTCKSCALGQLYGSFEAGLDVLRLDLRRADESFEGFDDGDGAVACGFVISAVDYVSCRDDVDPYAPLQEAWTDLILARRAVGVEVGG